MVWELVKDEAISLIDKRATLLDFDKVLGLNLESNEFEVKNLPAEVQRLKEERDKARADKDWQRADKLRIEIEKHGLKAEDTDSGTIIIKS